MPIRNILVLVSLIVLPVTTGLCADAPGRLNVLVLFNDDQRADTIAALGNPIVKTPNLDRLCKQGVAFTRAYMQGGFTGATCVPSRAMLMSGQSLFHVDTQLLRDETWPAAFGKAGYATFISGKWHNGNKSVIASFKSGRSLFLGGMSKNPLNDSVSDLVNGQVTPEHPAQQHLCAAFADAAIQFIKEQKSGPFFCYVPFDGPHDPHIVPKDFPVHYDPARIPLPPNFMPQHPFDNGELRIRDEQLLPHPRPPEKVREMIADYYRYISYLDMLIGRILDTLDASPHAKNTIVVFAADSGVARGSHGLIGKQNLYEHSIRVPLIVSGPGIASGRSTDSMCYLYDVLPTLGAMCRVPAPPRSDGMDLGPILRDPGAPGRQEMVFAYKGAQRAVHAGDWKLIHYTKASRTQLFNLKDDPSEVRDLSAEPDQASRVKELTALLKTKLAEAGDKNVARDDDAGGARGKGKGKGQEPQ